MFIDNQTIKISCFAALLSLASGCDPGDDEGTDEALDIIGEYIDEWGDTHMIDSGSWTNAAGEFHIDQWDDAGMWLVAQNDATNEFSPSLWSRFDWVWSGDDLLYCQSVYDGATVEAALAGSANRDDLMLGCGGFAWTNLTP
jgi:hypothetical protein